MGAAYHVYQLSETTGHPRPMGLRTACPPQIVSQVVYDTSPVLPGLQRVDRE